MRQHLVFGPRGGYTVNPTMKLVKEYHYSGSFELSSFSALLAWEAKRALFLPQRAWLHWSGSLYRCHQFHRGIDHRVAGTSCWCEHPCLHDKRVTRVRPTQSL